MALVLLCVSVTLDPCALDYLPLKEEPRPLLSASDHLVTNLLYSDGFANIHQPNRHQSRLRFKVQRLGIHKAMASFHSVYFPRGCVRHVF